MAELRIVALADGSPYADDVLFMAHQLARWTNGQVTVIHEVEVVMPGLLDNETKARAHADAVEGGRAALERRISALGMESEVIITYGDLLDRALEAMSGPGFFVAGIKGSGLLRRVLIGSTVVKLIERSPVPVLAVPRGERLTAPLHLYVGVEPGGRFEAAPVQALVQQFTGNVGATTFFSVTREGERARTEALVELERSREACALPMPTHVHALPGDLGLAELKDHVATDPHALLVLRKGGRELSDQLFRRYFINELVYAGRAPMVVLP